MAACIDLDPAPTSRLFIAAKAPRPGLAKTRLGDGIGHRRATALYAAFLTDLGARFDRVSWYVTPAGAWREIAPLVRPSRGTTVHLQPEGDWNERQRHLLRAATGKGDQRVVLLASDSPHLTRDYVEDAFAALTEHDLVLGPTRDGGYALIGLRHWHDVLSGVTMSGGDVLEGILARAGALDLRVFLLPTSFDVDEAGDLEQLRREVRGRRDLPATAAALAGVLGRG
ncbi:MAG: TIGR04282 family arsenosugar biosynthesis glycosyltransferase [Candidatus Dormibacteraceae bacterium]